MSKRVLIYYFDKLARRLTVEQMRTGSHSQPIDRLIFSLVIVNRCILNQLVKEIQSPALFSVVQWRLFRAQPSKSLMDIVMKDYRYVEDTTCDLLAEDTKLPKKEQREVMQLLKEEDQGRLLDGLFTALDALLRDKAALIEVRNKSSLKTLAYMVTAIEIVERLRANKPQSSTLEECHRRIETSSEQALLDSITLHCTHTGILFSLDLSGVASSTQS